MAKSRRQGSSLPLEATELRIIGGQFRGRKLRHEHLRTDDELVTRPMKHRVREAIFNLVGPAAEGAHAIDLFAGTGALGLEALSRGAAFATFVEKHVPTARVIEGNIAELGVGERSTLLVTSAFLWGKRDIGKGEGGKGKGEDAESPFPFRVSTLPWLVFCSPPYAFFVEREGDMLELIASVQAAAPAGSMIVVEADERFDLATLPAAENAWDIRPYPPAVVAVWRKAAAV